MEMINLVAMVAKMLFVVAVCLGVVPIMVWFERRGAAWMQGRVGPNRVGPFGLLQPLADVIKFFSKEDFVPKNANKFYYYVAPMIAIISPLCALVIIPFGGALSIEGHQIWLEIAHADAGVLFLLAFVGLEVYPVILAGWSSNNKYSVLGSLRGSSQMVSYEIAMGLALLSMLVVYGTLDLREMVGQQNNTLLGGVLPAWGAFLNPIGALIFWVSIFAQTNRLPFDLPEGESEIVAGFHLEYGAMKFALFFMAEYVAMIMTAAFMATVFFGGFNLLPGMSTLIDLLSASLGYGEVGTQNITTIFQFLSLFSKVAFFMFIYVWIRWTLPRFRFDQLMDLGWKILFPLSFANLIFMVLVVYWRS